MKNPWEDIALSDYESHMSLESVMQLQMLNQIMKIQLDAYDVTSAMILGIAGGNGLEHVEVKKYNKVYGIDINEEYLSATRKRYQQLEGILECKRLNLITEYEKLQEASLVIANLLIEYVGYDVFLKAIMQVKPKFVSCVIQINMDTNNWVSDSPYLHAFDRLDEVHHQMEVTTLSEKMNEIGFQLIETREYPLPNGKKMIQLDFTCQSVN